MSTLTSGYPKRHSVGDLTMVHARFTAVATSDTYASGLGSNVVGFWANDSTTTDVHAPKVSNSSGTFTFALSVASTSLDLYILATV